MLSVLLVSLVCGLGASQSTDSEKIIYGTDDRIEFYQASTAVQNIVSESIVSLIAGHSYLNCDDTPCTWGVISDNFICDGERFSSQSMFSFCSGTLIDSNKIVTAGHCMEAASECDNMGILFNYYLTADGQMATINPDDLYRCSSFYQHTQMNINGEFSDYLVIVLDRDVSSDKVPMTIATATDTKPAENTMLTLAGSPSGLPVKILQNAVQYNAAPRPNFDAWYSDCDTFSGNSGSGIFDVAERKLWGILSSGQTDYVDNVELNCQEPNVVANSSEFGVGEIICYPFPVVGLLTPCTNNTSCADWPGSSCVDNFCANSTTDTSGGDASGDSGDGSGDSGSGESGSGDSGSGDSGSGDSGSGSSTVGGPGEDGEYSCLEAMTEYFKSEKCCLPVDDDGSDACVSYLQVYTNCNHERFGMTSDERTCAADNNVERSVGECFTNGNTRNCNCGHTACGVRASAPHTMLAMPLLFVCLWASLCVV